MSHAMIAAFVWVIRPNPAVNTDARRRGFARAAVAGYLAAKRSRTQFAHGHWDCVHSTFMSLQTRRTLFSTSAAAFC
jgi:hypothetical protein